MASTSDLLKIAPKPELYWKAVWISFIPLGIAALLGVIDFLFNITIGIHMGSFAIPYWLLLAVPFVVAGAAIGCVETAEHTAVASHAPEEVRGSAFGLLAAMQSVGNLIASGVVGLLWTFGG